MIMASKSTGQSIEERGLQLAGKNCKCNTCASSGQVERSKLLFLFLFSHKQFIFCLDPKFVVPNSHFQFPGFEEYQ